MKFFRGGFIIKRFSYIFIFFICFLFLAGTVSAERNHRILPGDSLFRIAQNYQVDINTLIAANSQITNAADIKYGENINIPDMDGVLFRVTAYTAGYESTKKRPGDPGYGITASGEVVQENHTMACPEALPFGTKIHIPALDETYVCEDRGSAITNGRLDIYIEDLEEALEFGVQYLEVKVWTY